MTAIHMRSAVTLRSMAKDRLAGSDQPLNGPNLISKATLNVLQAGGGREIIAVEEKRLHVCHEHMSFKQEVVRLRKKRQIYSEVEPERWSFVLHIVQCSINICESQNI